MTDPLTQLPNRGYFLEYAATAVERAKRSNLRLVLFYIDFDGFKALNDTYGHVEGDNFLTEIGGRFKTILRKSDFCSRLGGDEFAVLVETEHASISACRPFVDGLLAEMRKPFTLTNGNKIKSCCSVGGAIFDPSADEEKSIEDFMNEADEAMYLAKQSGGDCLRYSQADAQPQPGSGNVAQIGGQELRPARRFYVEFVPIYGVSTLSLDGYECVINEHDGVLGANSQLRPGATELVLNKAQQDEWGAVAASVTELLDKLESGGTKVSFVCINLQVEQMSSPRFGERIRRVVDAVRDKLSIIIKFPESGLLEGNAALIRAIKELKALNVPVALAGFGSTQCCLMEVLQIPFDIIEIDKKMADRIMESEAGALGVKAVVRLAQELNKQILVSGIECERTWVELRKLGVDYRVGEQPLINKKSQKI
nr:diguanylate cyclase [Simiduia aestuariiviva]